MLVAMKNQINKPRVTLEDIARKFDGIDSRFNDMDSKFSIRFDGVDKRFDDMDRKFSVKFDAVNTEISDLTEIMKWSFGKLDQKIDLRFGDLEKRIDYLADNKVSYKEHDELDGRVSKIESKIRGKLAFQG